MGGTPGLLIETNKRTKHLHNYKKLWLSMMMQAGYLRGCALVGLSACDIHGLKAAI